MDSDERPEGAQAEFDFDRMTIKRFREAFPRARWDDTRAAWWVPGKTAEHRIARWRALEQSKADIHADAKGRDAFAFDRIESPYLEAGPELVVRTPYSRTVVDELRQVPYARWDDVRGAWVVPYRSYEDLKHRWPAIEAAAMRNEPAQRRARREAAKGTDAQIAAQRRSAERRRHRYPIPIADPPPFDRPVTTVAYGIVVFTGSMGELVEDGAAGGPYAHIGQGRDRVWATWRTPTLQELVEAWPSRSAPTEAAIVRGWWQPTKSELVDARRAARSRGRKQGAG